MASEATRKKIVQTRYWKELRKMLQDCGGIIEENGLNITKVAAAAGTCRSTTRKLFDGTTLYPHYRTVWCNLASLGWKMTPAERPRPIVKEVQEFAAIGKKKRGRKRS